MSAAASAKAVPAARTINPWFIAIAVVVPTFMEILDTTIANVALRYIAGGLSAAETDSEWVITSYLAANAIVLTISGWLSSRLGRRNYFLISIAVFTLASALCGLASSLWQIILFRVLQGLAGGGLQPSSQGILMDSFPPEKQGTAMTLFGVAAVIGPIVGPTLGGWLVVNYDWRWIFFINIPVGIVALVASYFLVHDPDYLTREREEIKKKSFSFDYIGLGLLVLAMSCWEVLLSKGQEWDWMGDPFWRIQTLLVIFLATSLIFMYRGFRSANSLVNLNVLFNRNLFVSGIVLFTAFGTLYAASVTLPAMLQTLFGYDAYRAGLVLSPGGLSSIIMMVVVGILIGKKVDVRYLIAAGLVVLAISNYWMAELNLQITPWQVIYPRMVLTAGLGLIFAPINVAAYSKVPAHLRGSAIAIGSVLRNEGGSFGVSMSQTFQQRREQFHLARVNEFLDPLNPQVNTYLEQTQAYLFQASGDPVAARHAAIEILDNLRLQQAASLAYFDVFWITAVLAIVLVPVVFLMTRVVAEKGAPVGGE